jgi:hypothetical protein
MARTEIPVDVVSEIGVDFLIDTAADSANGMQYSNTGRELLLVKNGSASSVNVTVDMKQDGYGRDGSKVIAVAAGATKAIGTFWPELYNQGDKNQKVFVDFSAATSVTVAVVQSKLY